MNEMIGHNSGAAALPYDPERLDDAKARVGRAQEAAAQWRPVEVEDQQTAEKLNDFLAGVRKLEKAVDAEREAQKRPHDEAAKAVQGAFKPLLEVLDKIAKEAKAKLTAFAVAEQKRAAEVAAAQRKAAEEAARAAAQEAAKAAARGDLLGQAEAEEAAKAAEKVATTAVAAPARIGSATGAGRTAALRTTRYGEVTSWPQVYSRYRDHPDVKAVLQRLVDAEIRAAKGAAIEIPGVIVREKQEVA